MYNSEKRTYYAKEIREDKYGEENIGEVESLRVAVDSKIGNLMTTGTI